MTLSAVKIRMPETKRIMKIQMIVRMKRTMITMMKRIKNLTMTQWIMEMSSMTKKNKIIKKKNNSRENKRNNNRVNYSKNKN